MEERCVGRIAIHVDGHRSGYFARDSASHSRLRRSGRRGGLCQNCRTHHEVRATAGEREEVGRAITKTQADVAGSDADYLRGRCDGDLLKAEAAGNRLTGDRECNRRSASEFHAQERTGGQCECHRTSSAGRDGRVDSGGGVVDENIHRAAEGDSRNYDRNLRTELSGQTGRCDEECAASLRDRDIVRRAIADAQLNIRKSKADDLLCRHRTCRRNGDLFKCEIPLQRLAGNTQEHVVACDLEVWSGDEREHLRWRGYKLAANSGITHRSRTGNELQIGRRGKAVQC